jgi:hypothetical protein
MGDGCDLVLQIGERLHDPVSVPFVKLQHFLKVFQQQARADHIPARHLALPDDLHLSNDALPAKQEMYLRLLEMPFHG